MSITPTTLSDSITLVTSSIQLDLISGDEEIVVNENGVAVYELVRGYMIGPILNTIIKHMEGCFFQGDPVKQFINKHSKWLGVGKTETMFLFWKGKHLFVTNVHRDSDGKNTIKNRKVDKDVLSNLCYAENKDRHRFVFKIPSSPLPQ